MRRRVSPFLKLLASIPLLGVYSVATCQANALRDVANRLDDQANSIDDRDPTLGDVLSDLVEDL